MPKLWFPSERNSERELFWYPIQTVTNYSNFDTLENLISRKFQCRFIFCASHYKRQNSGYKFHYERFSRATKPSKSITPAFTFLWNFRYLWSRVVKLFIHLEIRIMSFPQMYWRINRVEMCFGSGKFQRSNTIWKLFFQV